MNKIEKLAPLVLVVDDNETKRYTVVRTLTKGGYRIIEAERGQEALEKAAANLPDLMIVDIKMPDMNGFEVCRQIKNRAGTSYIPVLHFSATMNTSESRVYGLEEGADAFLSQDAKPEELLATVKALLRMKKAETELRKQNDRLQIISQAAEHLLASHNPQMLVKGLFEAINKHLSIDVYFNYMVDETGEGLYLHSYGGISEEAAQDIAHVEFGERICGKVALYRRSIIENFIQESDNPDLKIPKEMGIRVYACNPLIIGDQLLGTLAFASFSRDYFTPGELDFLHTICHYVALAKEKQDMLEKAQTTADELKEANSRKDDFLANMSHEIRTPMNAVLGLTHILLRSQPLTEKQEHFLGTLQTSAQSLLSLINDLLDIAKIESQHIELEAVAFDLKKLLEEVAIISSVQANSKGIRLYGNYDEKLPVQFIGDPTRLKQILINLTSNALKFTEKGEVSIEVSLNSQLDGMVLVGIAVKDTGIGIAPDKIESIFSKFSQGDTSITRKYGGTGLGLAITKTLVELMGGSVSVTSELGKGSVFAINIPFVTVPEPELSLEMEERILQTPRELNGTAPRILLVEDYPANVLVATAWMHNLGYSSEVASNGNEAIDKLVNGQYDVVLMDIQMPGMDGLEATRRIRAQEKQNGRGNIPIIGLTAYASKADMEKCLTAGMDDYISKPFNPVEFEQKINSFLRRKMA